MIDSTAPSARASRPSSALIAAAFLVYAVFQLHAVAFHGYWGQDWIAHKTWIRKAALDPWDFITRYTPYQTNPPLYDLIGAAIRRLVGLRHYLAAVGTADVMFGLAGMGLVLALSRRFIVSPVLRAACMIFVLFLPFAMIHAEVISNDALTTPVFFALLWLLSHFDPSAPSRRFWMFTAGLAVALMAAVEVKFTFGSFIIATAIWMLLQWWTGALAGRRLAALLLVAGLIPGVFTYLENARFRNETGNTLGIDPPKHLMDAAMNPASIAGLREADADILDAPPYNLTVNREYTLLASNKHSLAAMLQLSIFTDVLNIYQDDPYDSYFGRRTIENQSRMTAAVRAALPASIVTLIAVVAVFVSSAWSVIVRRRASDVLLLTLVTASLGWFFSLVVLYPSIPGAYMSGWWTPRLHAPALIGFFLTAFIWLDRRMRRWPRAQIGILVWVVLQSALQLSFLWPRTSDEQRPAVEANRDVHAAAFKAPVMRVFNWQDAWNPNAGAEAWLADTVGVVINRGPGTLLERWTLQFRLQAGPSLPGRRGTIRISSGNDPAEFVPVDDDRTVTIRVQLAEGRNDVRFDLVSPPTVELPDDPLRRNVRISNITLTPDGPR